MYLADDFKKWNTDTCVDGKWVCAKPEPGPFICRLRDAWWVLTGRAEAVYFITRQEQKETR